MTDRAPTPWRHGALLSSILTIALLAACEPATEDTAPTAVNLQLESRTIHVGIPVGMAGTVGVGDPDGNLQTLHLALLRPDGSPLGQLDVPIQGAAGQTSGTLPFAFDFTADVVGTYTLEAWVEDADGQLSARLRTTTSEVTAAATAPSLTNLQATVPDVFVGVAATVDGTVDFTDGDGDLTTLVVTVKDPYTAVLSEVRVPVADVTGDLVGTAPFRVTVLARTAGAHTLEVVAEDADGEVSRAVSRTFTAVASPTAPQIRNFDLSNQRAFVDIATAMPVAFDFTDSDADLTTLHVRVEDPAQALVLEREVALDVAGQASGSLAVDVFFTAATAGRHTMAVWLEDADGELSHRPELTFDAQVPSTTAPRLYALALVAGDVYVGKPASIGGTVKFDDVDGNVQTLVLRLARPDQTTLAEAVLTPAGVAGQTAGTLPFTLDFVADDDGIHQLELWAEDADGEPSQHLLQSLTVRISPTAPTLSGVELDGARGYVDVARVLPIDFTYTDSDANVSTFHVRILSPTGAVASESAVPLPGALGQATGTAAVEITFTAAVAGRHTLEAWLSDTQGETSPRYRETFDATVPSTTAPQALALTVAPGNYVAGFAASVSGTLTWQDLDGDVDAVVVRVTRPGGATLTQVEAALTPGPTSGTAAFQAAITPDVIGGHTLSVWLVDAADQPSAARTQTLDVKESATAPRLTELDLASGAKAWVDVPTPLPVTLAFTDTDGNVVALHARITSPAGSVLVDDALALPDAAGLGAGELAVSVPIVAPAAGRHTLEAWLVDAAGERSRSTTRTFDAVVASTTAPGVSGLDAPTPTLYAGRPGTLTGTLDWTDIDGNAATVVATFTTLGGAEVARATTPLGAASGAVTGEASFTLDVVPTALGVHELAVWVEDGDGQPSRHLTKTLTVGVSPTAPVASDLTLAGLRAYVGITTVLPVGLDFADADANVATLGVRVKAPGGAVVLVAEQPVPGAAGDTSGRLAAEVAFTAAVAGRHTLEAWLVDAAGEASQVVVLTFDATVAATTAPRAFGLTVTVASAIAAKPGSLAGTVDFEDVDGNVATLRQRLIRPDGTVLRETSSATPGAAGDTAGELAFTLTFTPDVVGFHTLELWLEDGDGQASTRLTRGVSVEASATAPVLSGLDLGASRALVGIASPIAGTVDFTDADTNIQTLHLRVTEPGGAVALEATKAVASAQAAGELTFSASLTATVEGRHTLTAWLVDALGETSATVTRTFDALRTNTTPSVSGLALEVPAQIFLREEVLIPGTVQFSDVDMNVATLHTRVTRPSGTVLVEAQAPAGVAGQASGALPFEVALTPDAAGLHKIEVWVVDAAGQSASKQSKSVVVLETRPAVKRLSVVNEPLFVGKASSVSGTVELTDVDGNPAAIHVQVVRPDGTAWPEVVVAVDAGLGLVQAVVPFAFELTPDVKGTHTLRAWVVDADAQASAHATWPLVVGDTSNVASACAALAVDCTGEGLCYDVGSTTCEYFESHLLTPPDVCDTIGTTGTQAMCVASTTDPTSPLLTATNRCKMVQYWSYPTDAPIDCRCPEARFDQRCMRPYFTSQQTTFGAGPRIRTLASTIQAWGGIVEGREWLLPVKWSTFDRPNETMIYGVNLDTGARRFFSGAWNDPANGYTTVGAGDALLQVMDLQKGPDGMLYAVGAASDIAAPKLWRIDPVSGARTKIFDEATAPESALCPNFSSLPGRKVVQMATQGWTMDGQGRFYFSNVGMPGPSILRLEVAGVGGAAETRCEYLTRIMDCPLCTTQANVGGGYDTIQFDFTAFTIRGDELFAASDKRFVAVNLANGQRRLVSYASDVGAIGTGPINAEGLADRYTTWDPHREVFWTVGALGGSLAVVVDPDTGDRTAWPCFHDTRGVLEGCGGTGMALLPGPLNFGGMVIDPLPPHDLYFAHDQFSIVKYEVRTGNAYNFSL